jgi:hypothetical protein
VLFDVEAALAKTSLSPVAHATNGFTHGRVWIFSVKNLLAHL